MMLPMYIELMTPQNTSGRSSTSCGPGVIPRMRSAPKSMPIVALAGMPSVSSGMNDDVAAALFARLRGGDALDGAAAEALGILRASLLGGVGRERGEDRAAAGEDAEEEADDRAAADGAGRLAQVLAGGPDVGDRGGDVHLAVPRLEVVEDLADAEQAHRDDDEVDAVGELEAAEGVAPCPAEGVPSDGRQEQAEGRGDQGLEHVAAADGGDEEDTEEGERGVLRRAEVERDLGHEGREQGESDDRDRRRRRTSRWRRCRARCRPSPAWPGRSRRTR